MIETATSLLSTRTIKAMWTSTSGTGSNLESLRPDRTAQGLEGSFTGQSVVEVVLEDVRRSDWQHLWR